jgi:hypothetical protein
MQDCLLREIGKRLEPEENNNLQRSILILALIALLVVVSVLAISFITPQATSIQPQLINQPSVSNNTRTVILSDPFEAPEYDIGGATIALAVCIGTFAVFKVTRKTKE